MKKSAPFCSYKKIGMFPSIFSIQRLVDDASIHNGKRNLIGCATPPPLMGVSVPAAWYLLQNPQSETWN